MASVRDSPNAVARGAGCRLFIKESAVNLEKKKKEREHQSRFEPEPFIQEASA